jgi:hypothetical protein
MNHYLETLLYVFLKQPKLQADYSRYNAKILAEACSRGHITSVVAGEAHNRWYTTAKGVEMLREYYCLK